MAMTEEVRKRELDELNNGWTTFSTVSRNLYSVANEIDYEIMPKLKTMALLVMDLNERIMELETLLRSHQASTTAHNVVDAQAQLFTSDEPKEEPKQRDMMDEPHFVLVDAPQFSAEVKGMMESEYPYYSFAELDRMVGLKEGRIKDAVGRCEGQEFIRVRTDLIKAMAKLISPNDVTSFFERVGVRFLSKK